MAVKTLNPTNSNLFYFILYSSLNSKTGISGEKKLAVELVRPE
jgi:hypothetical protein